MACKWAWDKSCGKYWLPDCMGGAVTGGPEGCTCPRKPEEDRASIIDLLEQVLKELKALRKGVHAKRGADGA